MFKLNRNCSYSNIMASNPRPVKTLPAEHQDDSVMTGSGGSLSTTLSRPETQSGTAVRRSSRIQNSPKPDYKGNAARLNIRYEARVL